MLYPSHADYNLAVRYIGLFVSDSILKSGTPRSQNKGIAVAQGGEPLSYPGGFAKVYVVDCGSRAYALRVWLHEISDAAKRYHATTEFLKKHPLPFFVEHFEFVANGILVQGKRYPILRMEWVEGYSLGDFIQQNLNQPGLLRAAADAFAAMVAELHGKRVVHGDLQSENVLLRANNGTVRYKLIDYDTLVVPALLGQPTVSTGLPSYQHPNRAASTTATERDDYFSELVIYTCLCALAENPNLWAEFPANGRDKELLFDAADFTGSIPTALFQRLHRLGGTVGKLAVILWNFTRCPNIQLLLPLEKVIELSTQPTAAPTGNASAGLSRSSFDNLLKQKLIERQARRDGLPDSWLDDFSFQSRQKRNASPDIRGTPVRQSPPPSPSGGATQTGGFQETLDRMQKAPAKTTTTPAKSTSGNGVAIIVITVCVTLAWLLSKCENDGTAPSRITPPENSTPAEKPKAPAPAERAIEAPAPKIPTTHVFSDNGPEQTTIEQQRAENRKRAEEQFKAGWDYGQQEQFTDAAAAYRKAVEIDPSYATAWHNLGWALAKLGKTEAISAFEKAVELQPAFQDGWHNLALAYAGINKVEKVSDALIHLRILNRDRAQALTRQFNSDFVQKLAIAEYPSLGVLNSPLNREFVARYRRYKASTPAYFDNSDWPLLLAQEAARAIESQ